MILVSLFTSGPYGAFIYFIERERERGRERENHKVDSLHTFFITLYRVYKVRHSLTEKTAWEVYFKYTSSILHLQFRSLK